MLRSPVGSSPLVLWGDGVPAFMERHAGQADGGTMERRTDTSSASRAAKLSLPLLSNVSASAQGGQA